jgi:hypothetical protein
MTSMGASLIVVVAACWSGPRAGASEVGRQEPPFDQSREGQVTVHGAAVMLGVGAMDYLSDSARALITGDFVPPDDRDPMTRARRIDRAGIVPLGLGFALSFRGLYGEARLMYRPTFAVGGLGSSAGGQPTMQAWYAGLAGGVEF